VLVQVIVVCAEAVERATVSAASNMAAVAARELRVRSFMDLVE
jgi:hypothetical protein